MENLNIIKRNDSFTAELREKEKLKPILGNRSSTRSSGTSVSISFAFNSSRSNNTVNPAHFPVANLISRRVWEGQRLCMKNADARNVYASYVSGMTWMEKISVQLLEQVVKRRRTQDTQEVTFNDYSLYPRSRSTSRDSRDREEVANTMRRCTQLKIKDSLDQVTGRKRELIETCFQQEELKYILLVSLWPIFLDSPEYRCLHSTEPCIIYEDSNESQESGSADNSKKNNETTKEHDVDRTKRLRDIYYQTAKCMREEEIIEILRSGSWIDRALGVLETINLSVSIASAEKKAEGFPLVFVNKAFERTTQYTRPEALGRPCKFLQSANTEKEQIEKISEALSKGEGLKIAVTNARKDGSEFLNFLALRPVFDSEFAEKMTFVIAVQYDVSKEEASLKEIKMVEDFLAIYCNLLRG